MLVIGVVIVIDSLRFRDDLEIKLIRDGKEIYKMRTLGHSKLHTFIAKLLKLLGIKKYTIDLVTNAGMAKVASLLTSAFSYIAIGSDDGSTLTLDATNTALGNELQREQATTSVETTNVTNDTAVFQATFNFTSAATIQESGVFDASTGGTMLCRQTFPALNVQAGDSLVLTWKITVQ